ncbi:hypothetical protein [Winogradskya humida]|uniref:DUF4913 domain-containing protein n=1 Tax=Winogradskya humida TaxID=113566 RepID=A0ABQ4A212_9ACTN|nr:hypothetical protein [Actinoplanes humidus]GIE24885.1 hypothetical protein Ahu01nite_079870 [Actinoplanes humidus]
MDEFAFTLPEDAPPDLAAVAELGNGLHRLTQAVDELHQQHLDLRDHVTAQATAGARPRKAPASIPWPLRWRDLDRQAGAEVWGWLLDWTGWMVDRYQLAEEIPACWPQHSPLIEELTALAAAWHDAYDDAAPADSPLLWHERLARARIRLRDFDDFTRCRTGVHTDRRTDLTWPDQWLTDAEQAALADLATRPLLDPSDQQPDDIAPEPAADGGSSAGGEPTS